MVLGAVATTALVTFIFHELEHPDPVVDLRVFKNRNYSAGTGLNFLLGIAVLGASYLFSLFCGAVMHYQALDIGRIFLLAGLSQISLMPIVGKMSGRVDPRYLLVFGVTALSNLPPDQRGNATGLFNLARELGGSLGTSWMGKIVADGIADHTTQLAEHVSLYDPITQEQWFGIMRRGMDAAGTLMARVTREAMVLSFEDGFRITMTVIGLGRIMVLLLEKAAPAAGAPSGAHGAARRPRSGESGPGDRRDYQADHPRARDGRDLAGRVIVVACSRCSRPRFASATPPRASCCRRRSHPGSRRAASVTGWCAGRASGPRRRSSPSAAVTARGRRCRTATRWRRSRASRAVCSSAAPRQLAPY